MDYTDAIIWYLSWPVLIYVAYRFVWLNIRHHARMEELQLLKERVGETGLDQDPLLKENPDKKK
ncbi:hypothetical protein [Nitratifractor sp.]|uniref:hypothetical protein n=1 Tax=Nitratifractor sp. TaxID=2268144 RepID=UPI0025F17FDD|nr:hypothetical protein [Nitratifractor sp.]